MKLYCGEALATLQTLPDCSVDSVVTDPPAGISFMNMKWDSSSRERFIESLARIMNECGRVAKPGAYALVWALPRTSHWTGAAIEDAGWTCVDVVTHLFGQGFPKHRSKLKPAAEFWWLAWKPDKKATPLPGLDACRIGDTVETWPISRNYSSREMSRPGSTKAADARTQKTGEVPAGRWPANVVLSHHEECVCIGTKKIKSNSHHPAKRGKGGNGTAGHKGQDDLAERRGDEEIESWRCHEDCPVRMLDEQSGELTSGKPMGLKAGGKLNCYSEFAGGIPVTGFGDSGGASRFFYVAKAGRGERNAGCEDMEKKMLRWSSGDQSPGTFQSEGTDKTASNHHPTVKPIDLMRWLCRLITPPHGTVLDCFMGSGTTGVAALEERMKFIGIEREPEYFEIAKKRITSPMGPLFA